MYYNEYTESEECKLLLASIKEDDPYKESKKHQIKRWCIAYSELMELWEGREPLFLTFQKVFSDESCWEATNTKEQVKLNRYILAKKLLALKTQDGKEHRLIPFQRYRIACWCCCEEEIKNIFEEFKLTRSDISVEKLVSRLRDGALMVFWSHVISHQEQKLPLNNEHLYVYGFRSAMPERMVEALAFFWDKLQSVDTLSFEQKDNLLMEVALYKTIYRNANAEMIEFAMKHLNEDKYPELLKRDLEQNGYYLTRRQLENEYFFDSAKKLFQFLNPEEFDCRDYATTMYSVLSNIDPSSDDSLISAAEDYLTFIWHHKEFENHRKYFLNELSRRICCIRRLIADLVRINKATTILSEIINALSPDQMEDIKDSCESSYEEFIKVRNTSGYNSIVGQVSALSLDREYLQQEIVAFRQQDSVSEIEINSPMQNAERNSPDLFNPRMSEEASGRGR